MPAAQDAFHAVLEEGLTASPPARAFARSLLAGCGVRLRDIVDHVTTGSSATFETISNAGWREAREEVWTNEAGLFPPFVRAGSGLQFYFRVQSVDQFLHSRNISSQIEGKPHGPARRARVFAENGVSFWAFERNGHSGFDIPDAADSDIRLGRLHLQTFRTRRRQYDRTEDGLAHTEALVDRAVSEVGQHRACHLWLRAEEDYWMLRCAAGRLQKARQDTCGIGWVNIDHHTYDGSRRHFRHTIRILEKLGYELREMIYAGELAGWGSQVLEQPVAGSTVFADVDLAPHELDVDFSHDELPELPNKFRAGVVSALHGESILEAGLNHVAGLYDQRALRAQLAREGVKMMTPFSDTPFLYQELTTGDWVAVDPKRVDALEAEGCLGSHEAEKIRMEGAILTHLENIERNDGFKGFNKRGIDGVLRKIDPRAYDTMKRAATPSP